MNQMDDVASASVESSDSTMLMNTDTLLSRKRERDCGSDVLTDSARVKRVRKANTRYQEYEVPKGKTPEPEDELSSSKEDVSGKSHLAPKELFVPPEVAKATKLPKGYAYLPVVDKPKTPDSAIKRQRKKSISPESNSSVLDSSTIASDSSVNGHSDPYTTPRRATKLVDDMEIDNTTRPVPFPSTPTSSNVNPFVYPTTPHPATSGSFAITTPTHSSLAPHLLTSSARSKRSKALRPKADFYRSGPVELSSTLGQCQKLLGRLMKHRFAWPFLKPVDPLALKIPDYFDIIKYPMDLGTIRDQISAGFYENVEEFAKDVRLVWANAFTYNAPGSDICIMATELSTIFETDLKGIPPEEPGQDSFQAKKKSMKAKAKTSKKDKLKKDDTRVKTPKKDESSKVKKPSSKSKSTKKDKEDDISKTLQQLQKDFRGVQKQIQNFTKKRPTGSVRPMKLEEKKALSQKINQLPQSRLGEVLSIINERMPLLKDTRNQSDVVEIEIDIDALDDGTLRKLEKFVNKCFATSVNNELKASEADIKITDEKSSSESESDSDSDSDSDSTDSESDSDDSVPAVEVPRSSLPPIASIPPLFSSQTLAPTPISSPLVGASQSSTVPFSTPSNATSVAESKPLSASQKVASTVSKPRSSLSFLSSLSSLSASSLTNLPIKPDLSQSTSLSASSLGTTEQGSGTSEFKSETSNKSGESGEPLVAPKEEKNDEVILKNELSWSLLESNIAPLKEEVVEKAVHTSDLWSEFREKDQLIKQREKETKEKEEEEKRQRQMALEKLKKEEEARKETELQRLKEQEEAEQQMREQIRLQSKLERERKANAASLTGEQEILKEFDNSVEFAT